MRKRQKKKLTVKYKDFPQIDGLNKQLSKAVWRHKVNVLKKYVHDQTLMYLNDLFPPLKFPGDDSVIMTPRDAMEQLRQEFFEIPFVDFRDRIKVETHGNRIDFTIPRPPFMDVEE